MRASVVRSWIGFIVVAPVAFGIAGCASPVTEPSPTFAPTTAAADSTKLQIGESASIVSTASGATIGSITVDSVQLDPACDATPASGHFIAVTLTVSAAEAVEDEGYPFIDAGKFFWAADSTEQPYANSDECIYGEPLPSDIGSGVTATGVVILDVQAATGTLTYSPRSAAAFTVDY